jgi:hypothetical protein
VWLLDEPVGSSSPTAQIITAARQVSRAHHGCATTAGLRRRRAAEAELAVPDPENSTTRLRERLKSAEERLDAYREHGLPDRVTKVEARLDEQARRISRPRGADEPAPRRGHRVRGRPGTTTQAEGPE